MRERVKLSSLLLGILMSFSLLIMGCSTLNTVGWSDLPDGTRIKAIEYENISKGLAGTDSTYVILFQCPSTEALQEAANDPSYGQKVAQKLLGIKEAKAPRCVKVGEFGGASAGFLKAMFNGAAAGAAIGTGLALSGDEINNTDNSSVTGNANAGAVSSSRSSSSANAVSKSKAIGKGGKATAINKPRTKIELDD